MTDAKVRTCGPRDKDQGSRGEYHVPGSLPPEEESLARSPRQAEWVTALPSVR